MSMKNKLAEGATIGATMATAVGGVISTVAGVLTPLGLMGYGAYYGATAGVAALGLAGAFPAIIAGAAGAGIGLIAGKILAIPVILGGTLVSAAFGTVAGLTIGALSGLKEMLTSKKSNSSKLNATATPKATRSVEPAKPVQKSASNDFKQAMNDNDVNGPKAGQPSFDPKYKPPTNKFRV